MDKGERSEREFQQEEESNARSFLWTFHGDPHVFAGAGRLAIHEMGHDEGAGRGGLERASDSHGYQGCPRGAL